MTNFPEFDHRALPPAEGSSIGELARRRAFQGMPWKARRHENWGIFNRHIWVQLGVARARRGVARCLVIDGDDTAGQTFR